MKVTTNGNMTNDGSNTLVYDAENHLVSAANGSGSGTYTYDGNGQRVKKVSGGATIVTILLGSQVMAEYNNGALPSAPTNEYIYAGGQRIMSVQSGVTDYWHYDHLSPRVRTDSSGNVADQRGTFPYGETWYSPGQSPYMFTTYYRDYESGNDYAQARYYVSRLARFSAMDPMSGSVGNPQSLNRYSYALNDPANLADPLGLDPCDTDTAPGGCVSVSADPEDGGDSGTSSWFAFGGIGDDGPPPLLYRGGGPRLGWNPLLLGPMPQPPPPPGYQQCIEAALREVLASGETPNENNPYGTVVGGVVATAHEPFNIFVGQRNVHLDTSWVSGHPGIFVRVHPGDSPRMWSSAFGRYQITFSTAHNPSFGFTDFSPAGQDAAANMMLNFYDAVQPAMDGNLQQAVWNMWPWASMPDSPLPGPKLGFDAVQATFQNALNTLPECQ